MLSLKIALKFHKGLKHNSLISLVSLVSIIGIIVSIAVPLIALSIINGFKYELNNRILSIIPHIQITAFNTSNVNWEEMLTRVFQISNVIDASFYINFTGIIEFRNKWHALYINSVNLKKNVYTDRLLKFIDNKTWDIFNENKKQIILGKGVLDALQISPGDWVSILINSDNYLHKKFWKFKKIDFQVSGVLNLNSQLDRNFGIISFVDAQCYCNNKSNIEGILVLVDDIFNTDKIVQKIKKLFDNDYFYIHNWTDTYGYIYRDIQMVRMIVYLSMVLIVGISCFNVISVLFLSIRSKNYDIMILRSLGAQNILIKYVFMWYGLAIYFFSSLIGITLGITISLNITYLVTQFGKLLGNNFFSQGVYFINFLPSKLNIYDIITILIVTLLVNLLIIFYVIMGIKKNYFSYVLK